MSENAYLKFGDQEVCSATDGMSQFHRFMQVWILCAYQLPLMNVYLLSTSIVITEQNFQSTLHTE